MRSMSSFSVIISSGYSMCLFAIKSPQSSHEDLFIKIVPKRLVGASTLQLNG